MTNIQGTRYKKQTNFKFQIPKLVIGSWLMIIFWLLFFGCWSLVHALSGVASDPSNPLFNARQLGMGGLSISFAHDANGVFTNPAELTNLEFPQLTTSSRRLLMDETQYLLLGWAVPTSYGTFGLGYVSMGTSGSIPTMLDPATQRIIQNPSIEVGSYNNTVLAVSYSRNLTTPIKLAIGGNLKFFNQALSGGFNEQGTGMSLDLGLNYQVLSWLTAGSVLQNVLGGSVKWASSEDKISNYYKMGAAANILGPTAEALIYHPQNLRAGLELDLPNNVLASSNSMLFHFGLEYSPFKNLFLRAGLNQESAGTGLTFGVGIVNGGFRFDYAYVARQGLPGDNPHYFSLSYVGERVVTSSRQLKRLESALKFLEPKDRSITDRDTIPITAEAKAKKIYDEKTVWTVTAISSTFEVKEVFELEDLKTVYLNGIKIEQTGTIETSASLSLGRNVFRIDGYYPAEVLAGKITPEVFAASAEVKVLRFQPFADTPMNFWAIEPIALNVTLGLVKGYPDNTFKPEKGISRAELVTLLVRTLGASEETLIQSGASQIFKDVTPNHWAAKFVNYGSSLKYVTGYPDSTFKPNKVLTRAEGVTILARYAGLTEEVGTKEGPFPDLKPEFWANKYIMPAKTAGLLKYLEGKEFKPSEPFTRAEACEVLYRIPVIQKKVNEFWETGIVSGSQ